MYFGQNGYLAANGTRIETPTSIYQRTNRLQPQYRALNDAMVKELREHAASAPSYATPMTGIGGSRPPGLGFAFGDSWARVQRDVMEFSMPSGQPDIINMSLRFAFENAYINKAMRLKTLFTTKGVKNATADDLSNDFFDQVIRGLYLDTIFRQSVWLYYTAGLVPILLPEQGEQFNWVEILDPRMVRTERNYGKTSMWVVADERMKAARNDQQGRSDPRNKAYWDALPKSWKRQLLSEIKKNVGGDELIELETGSYLVIENRFNPVDRSLRSFDGAPLQSFFPAAEQYRMAMAGQFATSFLAKNIIALVSVGDPQHEGPDLYMRPDDQVLLGLQNTFQNPNKAMWIYGDPTLNVRYITPGKDAFDSSAFGECKEVLKNLLPGPFWYNESGGSYADATVEMQSLEEEATACQNQFDSQFWTPIYERSAEGRPRIAKKNLKPPIYDRSALRDRIQDLTQKSNLYSNGGLDIKTLIAEHGYDPNVITERLRQQQGDAKRGIYMPAFEQKQGIVAAKTYGINKLAGSGAGSKGQGGKGGRPSKPGSKPQAEKQTGRVPRKKGK